MLVLLWLQVVDIPIFVPLYIKRNKQFQPNQGENRSKSDETFEGSKQKSLGKIPEDGLTFSHGAQVDIRHTCPIYPYLIPIYAYTYSQLLLWERIKDLKFQVR